MGLIRGLVGRFLGSGRDFIQIWFLSLDDMRRVVLRVAGGEVLNIDEYDVLEQWCVCPRWSRWETMLRACSNITDGSDSRLVFKQIP